jgi:hypothetical protein
VRGRRPWLVDLPVQGVGAPPRQLGHQLGGVRGKPGFHLLDALQFHGDLGVRTGGHGHQLAQPRRPGGHTGGQDLTRPRLDAERGHRHPHAESTTLEHTSESTEGSDSP